MLMKLMVKLDKLSIREDTLMALKLIIHIIKNHSNRENKIHKLKEIKQEIYKEDCSQLILKDNNFKNKLKFQII